MSVRKYVNDSIRESARIVGVRIFSANQVVFSLVTGIVELDALSAGVRIVAVTGLW